MNKNLFLAIAGFVVIAASLSIGDLGAGAETLAGPAVSPHLVISQFQTAGGGAGTFNDEFVEIFNRGAQPVDLNGYRVVYRSATGSNDVAVPFASWSTSTIIPPGGYYLIASTSYDWAVQPNMTYDPGVCQCSMGAGGGGLAIRLGQNNSGAIIDSVGWGTANNAFVEGAATAAPAANNSQKRKQNGRTFSPSKRVIPNQRLRRRRRDPICGDVGKPKRRLSGRECSAHGNRDTRHNAGQHGHYGQW
jgi:hypothetical protein